MLAKPRKWKMKTEDGDDCVLKMMNAEEERYPYCIAFDLKIDSENRDYPYIHPAVPFHFFFKTRFYLKTERDWDFSVEYRTNDKIYFSIEYKSWRRIMELSVDKSPCVMIDEGEYRKLFDPVLDECTRRLLDDVEIPVND